MLRFGLFRIPQRGSRWAPLSQNACYGEWRRIQILRPWGKWETPGRYVLIHLQPLLSLFFLFFREHIDVIMRMGLLAPFQLSGCIDFQFDSVGNRCNSPRTKFGIVSLPYHGVPPLFDTMGISDPSMTTIPIENCAFIHHFQGPGIESWAAWVRGNYCMRARCPSFSHTKQKKSSRCCALSRRRSSAGIDFPDHCQKSLVMTNHDKGKTFLSAANRRSTGTRECVSSTSKKKSTITFWMVRKKWIVKIYVG